MNVNAIIEPAENDAYSVKYRKVDVEIGDRKTKNFKPHFKLKRWDGECSLCIDFTPDVLEEEEVEEETDAGGNITKIKYKAKADGYEVEFEYYPVEPREETVVVNGEEHKFLQNELGGFEWKPIFRKKPKKLVWNYPIQIENLVFHYQPPLHPDHPTWADTDGDGIPDNFRPENVVGSFAVYHATRSNIHRSADAEKYKSGKVGHFYYPYLIDADGWKVRAEDFKIDTEKGLLSITLPQDFLDAATYPIVVDPTFGYTSAGGTESGRAANYLLAFHPHTCPIVSQAVSISWYGRAAGGGTKGKFAIYKNSDDSLTGYTVEGADIPTTNQWVTREITSGGSLTAVAYMFIIFFDGNVQTYYDAVGGFWYGYRSYAYNSFPDPANLANKYYTSNVKFSVYCTYCVLPTVTTQAADNIGIGAGTLHGTITATGDQNASERGFDWDYNSGTPYAYEETDLGDFGVGVFEEALTGLTQGNTIYFRGKAYNAAGWGYGSENSFRVPKEWAETPSETVSMSDSRIFVVQKQFTETIVPSDSLLLARCKILSESIDVTSYNTLEIALTLQKPGEAFSLTDSMLRQLAAYKGLTEIATLSDTLLSGFGRYMILSDAIDITSHSALDVVLTLPRPSESISLTDNISKTKTSFRVFAETATLVDSVIKGITRSPFAETLTLSGSIIKGAAKSPLIETVSLSDSIIKDGRKVLYEKAGLVAPDSSCVLRLDLDENRGNIAKDTSGLSNDGIISGASWVDGKYGKALDFDGTDNVNCGNDPSLQVDGDFTIIFWVYPHNLGAKRENPMDKSYGGEFAFTLEDDPEAGKMNYYHGTSRTAEYYWGWAALNTGTVQDNEWQMIAVTRNISETRMTSYYNGDFHKTALYSTDPNRLPSTSGYDVLVGRGYASTVDGVVDGVRIYNRVLSGSEIKNIHEQGETKYLQKQLALYRILADSIDITTHIVLNMILTLLKPGETLSLTDNMLRQLAAYKSLTETATLSDAHERLLSIQRLLTETASLGDVCERFRLVERILYEAITLTDSMIKDVAKSPFIETATLADFIIKSITKPFAEIIALGDVCSKIWNDYKILNESASLGDSLVRQTSLYRIYSETTSLLDAISRISAINRIYDESLTLVDSVIKSPLKNLIESISLADVYSRTLGSLKVLYEKLGLVAPDTSCALRLNFDENRGNVAKDTSGKGNNATIYGSPSWVEGKHGSGLDFDDTQITQYVDVPHTVLDGLSDFTITFWAYGGGSGEFIISGSDGTNHNHMLMNGPTASGWHFYVWRRGGGYGTHIYQDLVQTDSLIWANPADPINLASGGLILCQEQDSLGGTFDPGQAFSGMIDEFHVYTGAITDAKMAAIYEQGETKYLSKGVIKSPFIETITLADSIIKVTTRSFVETTSLADSVIKGITRSPLVEAITLADTYSKIWNIHQVLTETIALSDTFLRGLALYKILTDSIDITTHITLNMILTLLRSGETLSLMDSILKEPRKFISETVTLSDSLSRILAFQRTLTDTMTLGDTVTAVKVFVKILTETLMLSDAFLRQLTLYRALTETITLSDTFLRMLALYKILSDAIDITSHTTLNIVLTLLRPGELISLTDIILKQPKKILGEIAALSDSILKGLQRTLTETVTLSDAFSYTLPLQRILTETMTLSDSILRQLAAYKSLAETVTLSDAFLRILTLYRILTDVGTLIDSMLSGSQKVLSEAISPSDTLMRQLTLYRVLAEAQTISDILLLQPIKTLTEIITLSDTLLHLPALQKILTETTTLSDNLLYTLSLHRTFTDVVALSDTFLPTLALQRILTETTVLSDTFLRVLALQRILTDNIDITSHTTLDMVVTLLRPGETISLVDKILKEPEKKFSEALSLSDTLLRQLSLYKILPEAVTLSDTVVATLVFIKTLTETLILSDSILRQLAADKILMETVALSDAFLRTMTLQRILTDSVDITTHIVLNIVLTLLKPGESLSLTDTILKGPERILAETATLTDNLSRILAIQRILTDTITLDDVVATIEAFVKTLTETLTLSDALLRVLTLKRVLTETSSLSDILLRQTSLYQTLAETLSLSDSLLKDVGKSLTEAAVLSDVLLRVLTLQRTLAETVPLSDSISKGLEKLLSEGVVLSDALQYQLALYKTLAETLTLSDTLLRVRTLQRIISETMTLSDVLLRQLLLRRTLTDTTSLSDVLLRQLSLYKILPETIALSDDIIATLAEVFSKILTETMALSDSILRQLAIYRTLAETAMLSDNVLKESQKAMLETVTLSDTFLRTMTLQRLFTETTTPSDTLVIQQALYRSLTENIALYDAFSYISSLQKLLIENVVTSDTLIRQLSLYRILAETTILSDALTIQRALYRILTETIMSDDALLRILALQKTLVENIATSDTWTRQLTLYRALTETGTLSDFVSKGISTAFTETIVTDDTLIRLINFYRIITEATTMSDILLRQLSLQRILAETATLSDTILKGPQRILMEIITLSDFIDRIINKMLVETAAMSDALIIGRNVIFRTFTETILLWDIIHGVGKNIVETAELSLMAKKIVLDVAEKSHELNLLAKEATMDVLGKTYELNLLTKKAIIGVLNKNQEIYLPTKRAIMNLIKAGVK